MATVESGERHQFSPKEQAALKFADKLTLELRNNDADIKALKEDFSDKQIVDLGVLIGLVNLTNRLTDPLGRGVSGRENLTELDL